MTLLLNLCMAVHVAALMAWFGALSLRRLLGAGQGGGEMRFLRAAGALALASGALWPWLQTGVFADTPAAAWDPEQVGVVLTQTRFGKVWLMREAAVALAALLTVAPRLAIGWGTYALVLAALCSLALLGHVAGEGGAVGDTDMFALAAHLLAAGAWVGALPALRVLAGRLGPADLALVLRRFSRYGLGLVAVVVGTGVLNAWHRLGSGSDLAGSGYGQILVAKVSLVGLMGVAAVLNRNRYTPRLGAGDAASQAVARRGLRRSIGAELALGVAVIALAVLLAAAEPPR